MPTRLRTILLASIALAVMLAACGGSSSPKFPQVVTVKQGDVVPELLNSELVVGQNRLSFGILDAQSQPIVDAKVHLTFYELNNNQTVKRDETDAASQVPNRDAGLPEQQIVTLADGSRHIILNAPDSVGIYSSMVNFADPGDWGVEMDVDAAKPAVKTTLRMRFNVIPVGQIPNVGQPAPSVVNLTAADVSDLAQVDSSATPSPDMHTMTIADALKSGKPTMVLFAAPGFCTSRFCGPELELMRKLYTQYQDKANFIHVEFYQNEGTAAQAPVDAARAWNLQTEPWFFVIDARGIITARFEGPAGLQELTDALTPLLPH